MAIETVANATSIVKARNGAVPNRQLPPGMVGLQQAGQAPQLGPAPQPSVASNIIDRFQPISQAIGQQQQTAIQPAVEALQASRQPLKDRFSAILEDIKGRESASISEQQRVTSREFGRRDIPLSSGLFDTTSAERLQPIRRSFAGLIGQTGAEREEALAGISTQIAGLQSGAARDAISSAITLLGQQSEQERFGQQFGLAERAQGAQESQFGQQFGLSVEQFSEQKSQFMQQFGLSEQQFGEQIRQFNVSQALETKKFNQDVKEFGQSIALENARLRQTQAEFRNVFALQKQTAATGRREFSATQRLATSQASLDRAAALQRQQIASAATGGGSGLTLEEAKKIAALLNK